MRSGWERLHDKDRGLPKPLAPWRNRDTIRKGGDSILKGVEHTYKYDAGSPCLDTVLDKKTLYNGKTVVVLPQWIDHQVTVWWHRQGGTHYVPGAATFLKGKSTWECGSGLSYKSAQFTCPIDIVKAHIVGPWGAKLPGNVEGTFTRSVSHDAAIDRPLITDGPPADREIEVKQSKFGKDQQSGYHKANPTEEEKIETVVDPKKCGRGDFPMKYQYGFAFQSGWDYVGNYSLYASERLKRCNVFIANPWKFYTGEKMTYDRVEMETRGKQEWGGCENAFDRKLPRPDEKKEQTEKIEGAVWCEPPVLKDNQYGWKSSSKGPKPASFNFASRYASCEEHYPRNPQCDVSPTHPKNIVVLPGVNYRRIPTQEELEKLPKVTPDTVVPADGRYIQVIPRRPRLLHPKTGEVIYPKPSSQTVTFTVSQDPTTNPYQDDRRSPDKDGVIDGDPEEPVKASPQWGKPIPGWHERLHVQMFRTPNVPLMGAGSDPDPFKVDISHNFIVEWYTPVLKWTKKEGGLAVVGWKRVSEAGSCQTSVQWRTASTRNAN